MHIREFCQRIKYYVSEISLAILLFVSWFMFFYGATHFYMLYTGSL